MGRDDQRQAVKNIPLEQLKPFKNHPFQVRDDEEFRRLVESIEIHGVIHPAVARQIGAECYELILVIDAKRLVKYWVTLRCLF